MTRTFDSLVQCPECGAFHTAETPFERWMRNHEKLDSRLTGIVRFDCDVLLHRYKLVEDKKGSRDLQCLMFIEVKSRGGDLKPSQHDTLSMVSQVLRNRRPNLHHKKRGRHAIDHVPSARCMSHILGRMVALRMFGGHLLQMEGDSPESSEWLLWDRKPIDIEQLIQLLRFELDPDSMKTADWRRRYSDFNEQHRQGILWA